MDIIFKIRHYASKLLLNVLGPADLDEANDPKKELDEQWDERFGDDEEPSAARPESQSSG